MKRQAKTVGNCVRMIALAMLFAELSPLRISSGFLLNCKLPLLGNNVNRRERERERKRTRKRKRKEKEKERRVFNFSFYLVIYLFYFFGLF
jgi:hypothetical protein